MAAKGWCYIKVHPNDRAKIDQEDRDRVSLHKWRVTTGTQGRGRVVTSIRMPQGVRNLTLGAFLMNPPKGMQVYPRRFNNGYDYRKSNLVVCTVKDRQRLLPKKRVSTSSQYRGVSRVQSTSRSSQSTTIKWRAAIEVDGRSINLGRFSTEAEAARAYNAAARTHFGSLAYQNPIGGRPTNQRRKA